MARHQEVGDEADEEPGDDRSGERATTKRGSLDVEDAVTCVGRVPRPITMLSVMRFGSARTTPIASAAAIVFQVRRQRRISTMATIGRKVKTKP